MISPHLLHVNGMITANTYVYLTCKYAWRDFFAFKWSKTFRMFTNVWYIYCNLEQCMMFQTVISFISHSLYILIGDVHKSSPAKNHSGVTIIFGAYTGKVKEAIWKKYGE